MAKAVGRSIRQVVEDPWLETFFVWLQIKEEERLDDLTWDWRSIMEANRSSMAYHRPEDLKQELWNWQTKAGMVMKPKTAIDKARKMMEELSRVKHIES